MPNFDETSNAYEGLDDRQRSLLLIYKECFYYLTQGSGIMLSHHLVDIRNICINIVRRKALVEKIYSIVVTSYPSIATHFDMYVAKDAIDSFFGYVAQYEKFDDLRNDINNLNYGWAPGEYVIHAGEFLNHMIVSEGYLEYFGELKHRQLSFYFT
jgi:hypothetical protein